MLELSPVLQGEYKLYRMISDDRGVRTWLALSPQDARRRYIVQGIERPAGDRMAQFKSLVAPYFRLEHPNVARLRDYFPEGDCEYLVYDDAYGAPLSDILQLQQHPLPEVHALELSLALVEGLRYLHARGCYMADFHPSNVHITEDGSFMLMHFGLARGLQPSIDGLHPYRSTPGYAAPEQCEPDPVLSPASDVYGLAALLFHLLTRLSPPAPGAFPYLRTVRLGVSEELETLLGQCLEVDPARRPALSDMRHRLRQLAGLAELDEATPKARSGLVQRLMGLLFRGAEPARG